MTCAWNPPGHDPVIAYTALAPPDGAGLVVEGDGDVVEGLGVVVEGDGDVVVAGGVVGDGVGLPVEPLAFQ